LLLKVPKQLLRTRSFVVLYVMQLRWNSPKNSPILLQNLNGTFFQVSFFYFFLGHPNRAAILANFYRVEFSMSISYSGLAWITALFSISSNTFLLLCVLCVVFLLLFIKNSSVFWQEKIRILSYHQKEQHSCFL